MAVAYETREKVSEVHVSAWNTTWPATGGCSSRYVFDTALDYTIPASTTAYYEPVVVKEVRDNRHINGRTRIPGVPYCYTPYFRSRVTTYNNLLRRRNGSNTNVTVYHQYGDVHPVGGTCTAVPTRIEALGPYHTEWNEVTHYYVGPGYTVSEMSQTDIDSAYLSVQNDVASQALTSYDALTELAEAREIPELVRSVSSDLLTILRALRGRFSLSDLRQASHLPILELLKHPKRVLRTLGSQWMRYRYAIMPLVYSYRDILKTVHRGSNITSRKTAVVNPRRTGVTLPSNTQSYYWVETTGNVTIRGSVFQHFDWESGARLAGVGINPLVTAWELIPYSFVIDWFVNVGDYIHIATSQSLATSNWACISRRTSTSQKWWVHYPKQDVILNGANRYCTPWAGSVPPTTPSYTVSRPEESQLLYEVVTDEYQRELFPWSVARLTFSPNLNWKRLVDSAVMVSNQLGTFNKFLKGH